MARSQSLMPKSNIRRRRTGCLTCRERRVRCGEEKPDCKNCSRKSRTCNWARAGDRFLHHQSSASSDDCVKQLQHLGDIPETATKSTEAASSQPGSVTTVSHPENDAVAQLPTPSVSVGSHADGLRNQRFDSWHMEPESSNYNTNSDYGRLSFGSGNVSNEELSCWRSEVFQNYSKESNSSMSDLASSICRSQSARLKNILDLEHSSPIPPNLEPNPEVFSSWQSLGASDVVVAALNGDKEIKILETYLRECAHWFDTVDGQRHYGRKCVTRMMTCPPWRAAALALSAKYLELQQRLEPTTDSLSLHLYQLAVQLAIDSISGRFDCVGTTAGCVILAVYEMMTVTYRDWRRHLRGCTSIYSHNHWNGDSLGLIGASFWNYARIDTWAAFCVGTETMLSSEQWFNHPEKTLRSTNLDEDRHAHVATWLLARVNNFIHRSKRSALSLEREEHTLLMGDLISWEQMGASVTRPVMQFDTDSQNDEPFQSVLFSSESSTIAYVMWHTALVLLLEFEALNWISDGNDSSFSIYKHARSACGIINTNRHSSCVLVDSVHPLWICGKHLKTKAEKFAVLELLAQIERTTGWKTAWRADNLREMWRLS